MGQPLLVPSFVALWQRDFEQKTFGHKKPQNPLLELGRLARLATFCLSFLPLKLLLVSYCVSVSVA